jgi:hypothetical protein
MGITMTVKELYELFDKFKTNDFHHLKCKVDWLFYTLIGGLITIITGLIILIVSK